MRKVKNQQRKTKLTRWTATSEIRVFLPAETRLTGTKKKLKVQGGKLRKKVEVEQEKM